jgi:hypothetical protein
MTAMTYDSSLPCFVNLVVEAWGADAIAPNLFLRDAVGRLSFIVLDAGRDGSAREALSTTINQALGAYADPSGISVATPEELFDAQLREAGAGFAMAVKTAQFDGLVRLVDRRVVGGDWLRAPPSRVEGPPRLFFVSLKGGVGRSTALCVLAAHLASGGQRVLAVDLDLESPGLGAMLLDEETIPEFGILDYLVETNLGEVDDTFIADMAGSSKLTAGRGVVKVLPALGARSTAHPENILSKISRAYLPTDTDPQLLGFTAKIEQLLTSTTRAGDYDVVLVDARAGLHESTAAAAVALRGDTLLFGIDQPQTFAGYRALFSQLALTLGAAWSSRLHLVEARVGADGPSEDFVANMTAIMPVGGEDELVKSIPLGDLRDVFEVDWDEGAGDPTQSQSFERDIDSTFIYESDVFRAFDPLKHPDRLDRGAYAVVFENFLEKCDEILRSTRSAPVGAHDSDR